MSPLSAKPTPSSFETGPWPLHGRAQEYAWGKVGRESRIWSMVEGARGDTPLAEFWLGTHPSLPSLVTMQDATSVPADSFVRARSELVVGPQVQARFGAEIPFMMKVLSVNPDHGLSVQLHPDAECARVLHERDPEHYPDDRHKPEIGVAITPVSLLYGCKDVHELARVVSVLPCLSQLLGKSLCGELARAAQDDRSDPSIGKRILSQVLFLSEVDTRVVVDQLQAEAPQIPEFQREASCFERLLRCHGRADSGLVTMWFMNMITIPPGHGIFIPANVPHAYLEGDLVECMACSDNVVRVGLTRKFKDIDTLIHVVDCRCPALTPLTPIAGQNGILYFDTPADEFQLGIITDTGGITRFTHGGAPGVLLCLGAHASVTCVASGQEYELKDGGAVLLSAEPKEYEVRLHDAVMYFASTQLAQ